VGRSPPVRECGAAGLPAQMLRIAVSGLPSRKMNF
jgi:hypothetical protein